MQRGADQGVRLWRRGRVPGGARQARQIQRLRESLQVRKEIKISFVNSALDSRNNTFERMHFFIQVHPSGKRSKGSSR